MGEGEPYHRSPPTVGANTKQRKIWSKFREMDAFAPHDAFVGGFEIDSDSIYQSILNLVFECKSDGSPDEALLQALNMLPEFREMRRYVYGDPINAGLSFLGLMPTIVRILLGASEGGEGGGDLADRIKKFIEDNAKELGEQINGGKDNGGGLSLDGEGSEIELMNQILNPHSNRYSDVRKIMKAMGSMITAANGAIRDKRKNVPGQFAGVTRGRDLSRLMTDGWSQMAVPELEDLFWAEWARDETRIMQVYGRERAARGPLVLVVDESGSMGADFEGMMAHEWARAILLTMCHVAQREGRAVHVVKFSSSHSGRAIRATKRGMNPQDFLWLTGSPENGGTNLRPALMSAFRIAEKMAQPDRRADIVLLTDADVYVRQQQSVLAAKAKAQAQVFCVLLSQHQARPESVEWLVDEFHQVKSLSDSHMLMSAAQFVVEK